MDGIENNNIFVLKKITDTEESLLSQREQKFQNTIFDKYDSNQNDELEANELSDLLKDIKKYLKEKPIISKADLYNFFATKFDEFCSSYIHKLFNFLQPKYEYYDNGNIKSVRILDSEQEDFLEYEENGALGARTVHDYTQQKVREYVYSGDKDNNKLLSYIEKFEDIDNFRKVWTDKMDGDPTKAVSFECISYIGNSTLMCVLKDESIDDIANKYKCDYNQLLEKYKNDLYQKAGKYYFKNSSFIHIPRIISPDEYMKLGLDEEHKDISIGYDLNNEVYIKIRALSGNNLAETILNEVNENNVVDIVNEHNAGIGIPGTLACDPEIFNKTLSLSKFGGNNELLYNCLKHIADLYIAQMRKDAPNHNISELVNDIYAEIDKLKTGGKYKPERLTLLFNQLNNRIENADNEKEISNGKLDGNFSQGNTGDCWLLASILSIKNNTEIKAKLEEKKCIIRHPNGDMTITLLGVNETYTFSKKEIDDADELSSGERDVRAIEMAVDKFLKSIDSDDLTLDLNGNYPTLAFNLLLGKCSKNVPLTKEEKIELYKKCQNIEYIKPTLENLDNIDFKSSVAVISASNLSNIPKSAFKSGNNLIDDHAYSLRKADSEYVYLINPHDSSKEIILRKDEFIKIKPDIEIYNYKSNL